MFAFPIHSYLYLPLKNSHVPQCVCVYFWCIRWHWPSLRGISRPLWATPAVAGVTEAKTSLGWGVRGLGKFLEVSENCCATPGSLLVHSWFIPEAPGSKRAGQGGGGTAGPRSHVWPARPTLLHPAHTSPCLQYLQSLYMNLYIF